MDILWKNIIWPWISGFQWTTYFGTPGEGKIELEEIYRFENGMDHKDGKLLWDVNRLFGEIVAGMKKCKELGRSR